MLPLCVRFSMTAPAAATGMREAAVRVLLRRRGSRIAPPSDGREVAR